METNFLNLENQSFESFFSTVLSKYLTFFYLFTYILLFISLIKLKNIHLKHPLKEH